MAIVGMRGTGDWATDERPKNFRESILFNQPEGDAPLLALTSKMAEQSVDDPQFYWWEELLNITKITVNGAHTSAVTTITVDASVDGVSVGARGLVAGDILMDATEAVAYSPEMIIVASDPTSDTSITVVRGFGGTTPAAIADNAVLVKIGNAFSEGSDVPTASNRSPKKLYNYTQIFKTVYDITGTAAATRTRTGDPVMTDRKRKMFDHSAMIEMAMMFGLRSESTGPNGKPRRTMGGLVGFLTTNRIIFGVGGGKTAWTEDNFVDYVSRVFDYTSAAGKSRIAFMGNSAAIALNRLAKTGAGVGIQYDGPISVYGMRLQKWVMPQGELLLKTHPLFTQHPVLTKSMLVIDPSNIKYKYLKGRDTKFKDDVQLPGADHKMGLWQTECSIEVQHEETMGYFGGLGVVA